MENPPENSKTPPQRKKLTKLQQTIEYKKREFRRKLHDYWEYDLPTTIALHTREVKGLIAELLEWAKRKI
jgi:hypothetical protein